MGSPRSLPYSNIQSILLNYLMYLEYLLPEQVN